MLELLPAEQCRFDVVALGEVMLRLDPGEGRIRTTREFRVSEGGGEYNVVRGLSRVFGLRTSILTALVDNEVGRLVEDMVDSGGVDTSQVRWVGFDGIGRVARNGLNFTERGYGVRAPLGVSDRGHSAVSQMAPKDVDWDHLFGELGVRWFHTGGIFAGLSTVSSITAVAATRAARRHGAVVSYDLNHRPSLWRARSGDDEARAVHAEVMRQADVVFGNPVHLAKACNLEASSHDFNELASALGKELPYLAVLADTQRTTHSASRNDWGGTAWSRATGVVRGSQRDSIEVFDRVGAGDSFASGLIFGLMQNLDLATALEYGLAHGALTMTTPGDASMASHAEVLALAGGVTSGFDR